MQKKTLHFFILTMLSFFYISAAKAHYPIQPCYYFPVKINNKSNYVMKLKPYHNHNHKYKVKSSGGKIQFLANSSLNVYDDGAFSFFPHALINPNEDAVVGWFKVDYLDKDNFRSDIVASSEFSGFVASIKFRFDLPNESSNYIPFVPFTQNKIHIIAKMTFDEIDGFSLKIQEVIIMKDIECLSPEFIHKKGGDVVINITDSDISKISLCQSPILMEY